MTYTINTLTDKMHQVKYNKTHFTLSVNSYLFRHQAAILREFKDNKGS